MRTGGLLPLVCMLKEALFCGGHLDCKTWPWFFGGIPENHELPTFLVIWFGKVETSSRF